MEQDLLARFTGDSAGQRLQSQSLLPPPCQTLSLRVGSEGDQRDRPERAQAAGNVAACSCPSSSRAPFLSPLVSVVVPGHPATAPLQPRPTDLPAACAGARPQTSGETRDHGSWPGALPQRPSTAAVPSLHPVGSTMTTAATATSGDKCRCDASSLCAQLMRGLAGDLDRARAQVALLTCENESLRHRLKRAAAEAAPPTPSAAAFSSTGARLHGAGLRCRVCRVSPATVLLAPREHLCLCRRCADACRDDPAVACWVCRGGGATARSGPRPVAPRPL